MDVKKLLLLGVLLLSLSSVSAVTVSKTAPESITFGSVLEVTIRLSGTGECRVEENLGNAELLYPRDHLEISEATPDRIAARPPLLVWELDLDGSEVLVYKVKPRLVGEYLLGATSVFCDSGVYYSNSLSVEVTPVSNGRCEPENGENYLTNPEDCPSGSADNYCDGLEDGLCDPDCVKTADVDCLGGVNWRTLLYISLGVLVFAGLIFILVKL